MKLPSAARLRRRREFLLVQQRGRRVHSGDVIVLALDSGTGSARIGITVSSKVANAVGRNRVKRWVREAFRSLRAEMPPFDLVVVARRGALEMGASGIRQALLDARSKLVGGRSA